MSTRRAKNEMVRRKGRDNAGDVAREQARQHDRAAARGGLRQRRREKPQGLGEKLARIRS